MSVDKQGQSSRSSEVEILIGIYDALSELRVKVNENATKHENSAINISKIERKLEDIDEKITQLYVSEAQTSIKFGIITFFATLLSVSGINYALGDDEISFQALPANQKGEIVEIRKRDNASD